jgi:hypothetical protein
MGHSSCRRSPLRLGNMSTTPDPDHPRHYVTGWLPGSDEMHRKECKTAGDAIRAAKAGAEKGKVYACTVRQRPDCAEIKFLWGNFEPGEEGK